jgi:Na+/melibiose symporter-like transporter
LSLTFNGIARTAILLIPLSLLFGLPNHWIITIFFIVILPFYVFSSVTGISWNYLLGTCVQPDSRGKLLGTLVACSGIVSFFSSNVVRLLRENEGLTQSGKYASIFGLGGVLMASSVLFFIPLKEQVFTPTPKEDRNIKAYFSSLLLCVKNKFFRRMIAAQAFSSTSMAMNTFLYIYAQNYLKVDTKVISLMLIVQTLGTIAGGFVTGKISEHLGSKRTIFTVECLGLTIPIMELCALQFGGGPVLMIACVFLMGFSRSGQMAYQTYLLEVAGEGKSIFYLVSKSMILLPFSFVSVLVGLYFDGTYPISFVYILQICIAVVAIVLVTRMKLFTYKNKIKEA